MGIVKAVIAGIIIIIAIVVIYNVVMWKWSKVDKYDLKERSKNKFLDIFEKIASLFDKKDKGD